MTSIVEPARITEATFGFKYAVCGIDGARMSLAPRASVEVVGCGRIIVGVDGSEFGLEALWHALVSHSPPTSGTADAHPVTGAPHLAFFPITRPRHAPRPA